MSWSLLTATVVGALLGLRYRLPALLAASLVVAAVTGGHAHLTGLSGLALLGAAALSVVALQAAYLITLALQYAFGAADKPTTLTKSREG